MKTLKWPLPRRGKPDSEKTDKIPDPDIPIASAEELVTGNVASKVLSVFITLCLVLSPLAFLLGLGAVRAIKNRPVAAASAVVIDTRAEEGIAGEIGTRTVVAWLGASRDSHAAIDQLLPSGASFAMLPSKAATNITPRLVAVTQSGTPHMWQVLVQASFTLDKPTEGYFTVPVFSDGKAARPLTLPAPAPGPSLGEPVGFDTQYTVSPNSALSHTAAEFLSAYLTGQGDVTRYVSPGITIAVPAPIYQSVKVTRILANTDLPTSPADGATGKILVSATVSLTKDHVLPVEYALTVRARAGRWEIYSVDVLPPLPASEQTKKNVSPTPTATSAATGFAGVSATNPAAAPTSAGTYLPGSDMTPIPTKK